LGLEDIVVRPKLIQRPLQSEITGFLLLQRAQRPAGRLEERGERHLEVVEFNEFALGFGQKVAQDLVLLTQTRTRLCVRTRFDLVGDLHGFGSGGG
jgi:hypothetical protein